MTTRLLTVRELNRATLARQLLLPGVRRPDRDRSVAAAPGAPPLEPCHLAVLDALEQVAGLQAQASRAAFIGLWARVPGFRREDLTDLLARRLVVKATLMRGTIHLVTADDYLRLRPALQPLLTRLARGFMRRADARIGLEQLQDEVQGFFDEPRTLPELRRLLTDLHGGANIERLAYALRVSLALLHVPREDATWGFPAQPVLVDAGSWLGRPVPAAAEPGELIGRYLRAFGPASAADVQAWSGLTGLRGVMASADPPFGAFCNEHTVELMDLPGAPLPGDGLPEADEPAPALLVPEWDSVLLGHDDRRRIVPDAFREPLFKPPRQIIGPAVLLDGFVAGLWRLERGRGGAGGGSDDASGGADDAATRGAARLAIEPFRPLTAAEREALALPGERLTRFLAPHASPAPLRFALS